MLPRSLNSYDEALAALWANTGSRNAQWVITCRAVDSTMVTQRKSLSIQANAINTTWCNESASGNAAGRVASRCARICTNAVYAVGRGNASGALAHIGPLSTVGVNLPTKEIVWIIPSVNKLIPSNRVHVL